MKQGVTIEVDVGIGVTATSSDGRMVANPRALAGTLKRLRKVGKAIGRSHKVHGRNNPSHRRERLYARRRRLHDRAVIVRKDIHHQATTMIAKSAGRVVETLKVAGMMRNRRLARAIDDSGMSGFLARLEYKCLWYGAEHVKADPWFPSSKLCCFCGRKKEDLTLSGRAWRCGGCGVSNERDVNAARNVDLQHH